MIRMKALRAANMGDGGTRISRGREFSVALEARAKELEMEGLAHRVETKMQSAPANKMEPPPGNKAADSGPFVSPGGATGADAPAPSLLPDHPPQRRRSARSRDDAD